MTFTVSFELDDEDLEHFRVLMRSACERAECTKVEEIIAAAASLLDQVRAANAPNFVLKSLDTLEKLLDMARDDEWRLPDQEGRRVINALAYFCEPEGLIPDDTPGLGFLDDAMVIELVGYELRNEIETYDDFCAFRVRESQRRQQSGDSDGKVTRDDWLSAKRAELHQRMRKESGGLRSLVSLFRSE